MNSEYKDLIINVPNNIQNDVLLTNMLPINFTIPEDIMNEIILKSNIDTIYNYCLTNKNKCIDYQFWKSIFDRDDLPLYEKQNSIKNYVRVYKKARHAVNEANVILDIIRDLNIIDLNIMTNDKTLELVKSHLKGTFHIHIDKVYTISPFHYNFGLESKLNRSLYYK